MPVTTTHLIDASPYIFRAWFSVPKSIVDPKGRVVNAVYGFVSFLLKYLADEQPTHIAITFDRHFNHSFRNEEYPAYKAQREESPKELEAQVDPCVEAAQAMGLATFIDERYEADDLIATIMHQTDSRSSHYVIVTSDKDLAQLVSERVTLSNPAKKERFDAAAVEAKFGVKPTQIVDYLALAGDAVDNIPGVKGIGPKTAAQLLQRYGSLEKIYEAVPAMKQSSVRGEVSVAAKLELNVDNAGLSKRLATVATNAPLQVTLDDLRYRGPDEARVDEVFSRLGFNTLRERAARG
ncbi:MAG TPA: 5'-3' exonuclease H3TH domain-containing protein [Thermoanaerobaculia bacterium]